MTLIHDLKVEWRKYGKGILWSVVFLALVAGAEQLTRYALREWALKELDGIEYAFYRVILLLFVVVYGLLRASLDNPALNDSYRNWLMTSPWMPGKRLPLGQVSLSLFDLVLLVVATLAWPGSKFLWAVPAAFLLPYNWTLAVLNFKSGQDGITFCTLALTIALPIVLLESIKKSVDWPIVVVLIAATMLVQHGWKRTLALFPWYDLPRWKSKSFFKEKQDEEPHGIWPRVHPWQVFDAEPSISMRQTWYLALLWAWAACVAVHTFQQMVAAEVGDLKKADYELVVSASYLIPIALAFVFGSTRVLRYATNCTRSLGLWARLRTGYFSSSRFRDVYLPWFSILGATLATCALLWLSPFPPWVVAFIGSLVPVCLAFGMGPTLAEWRLTGGYRMSTSPPSLNSRNVSSTPSAAKRS